MPTTNRDPVNMLNRMNPAAAHIKLGQVLADLIAGHNLLCAQHNVVTAKLDADAGVTDTNYTALGSATTAIVATLATRLVP